MQSDYSTVDRSAQLRYNRVGGAGGEAARTSLSSPFNAQSGQLQVHSLSRYGLPSPHTGSVRLEHPKALPGRSPARAAGDFIARRHGGNDQPLMAGYQ